MKIRERWERWERWVLARPCVRRWEAKWAESKRVALLEKAREEYAAECVERYAREQ